MNTITDRKTDFHGRDWTLGERVTGRVDRGHTRPGTVNKLWHEANGDLMVGVEWDRTKGQTYHVNGKNLERA